MVQFDIAEISPVGKERGISDFFFFLFFLCFFLFFFKFLMFTYHA